MRKRNTQRCSSTGFTLVELLVVIAIIAALVALSFPSLMSIRYSAGVSQTVVNMRQIGIANENYSIENHNRVNGHGPQDMPRFGVTNKGHVWRVAAYSSANISKNRLVGADVGAAIYPLHHPHLRKELSNKPDLTRWTVAVNSEFRNDGEGGPFPRMNKYDAANTIYCVSGFNIFSASQVDDPDYLELPSSFRGGPYFTKKKQLPCLYLDGRVVLEKFPIDPAKVDPSLQK